MNSETQNELSFDGKQTLITSDGRLPSSPKQDILNNKVSETLTNHNNSLNNGRVPNPFPIQSEDIKCPPFTCDPNMEDMEAISDFYPHFKNKSQKGENDNNIKCDNMSFVATNGDINDNEDLTDESSLMDQTECPSAPDMASDISEQINVDLKNDPNNQSISDYVPKNDLKYNFTEVWPQSLHNHQPLPYIHKLTVHLF